MDGDLLKFQQQLALLRQKFSADLPGRVSVLEDDWLALRRGMDPERLARLHRGVHSLAGSGATFGLPEVSRAARALEAPLKDLVQGGADRPSPDLSGLEGVWAEFKRACLGEAAQAAPAGAADPGGTQQQQRPSPGGPSREIVIVTQKDDFFMDIASRLGRFGYSPRQSRSLEDALPDGSPSPLAMIADCEGLPLDALTIPHGWRERGVPLMVIACEDGMEPRLRAVRLGADEYLLRPVDVGLILDKLESLSVRNPGEPYRVLIVDDEEIMAERNALVLRQNGIDARVLTDPMRILDVLEDFNAELVILDVYMPGCSGPEAAAVIRQKRQFMGLPILFLSGETELKTQFNAVSQGGDDFLIKPIEPEHLLRAVSNRVKRYRAVHSMMVRDSLTGLLNHTNMKQQIMSELERLRREGGMAALAVIDLDKFKSVNDTYGHPAGDVVLKNLSRFLTRKLRRADMAGRMGGEEFAVLLRGVAGRSEAVSVMDKLREAFAEVSHSGDWGDIKVTFSCGMAFYPDFTDAASLSAAADLALYEAKRGGRNRVCVHGPSGKDGAS